MSQKFERLGVQMDLRGNGRKCTFIAFQDHVEKATAPCIVFVERLEGPLKALPVRSFFGPEGRQKSSEQFGRRFQIHREILPGEKGKALLSLDILEPIIQVCFFLQRGSFGHKGRQVSENSQNLPGKRSLFHQPFRHFQKSVHHALPLFLLPLF